MDAGWSEEGECSTSADDGTSASAGRIRKRRFSSARIQPTRIKKVMQSDEDIGRMVASVPVAIGSAMEHFAEKLLEAAAGCVPFSTSRTLSPMHIRYAVMQNPHFAFLESMLKEVPLPKLSTGTDCAITPTQSGQPGLLDCEQLNFLRQFQSPSTVSQLMDVSFQLPSQSYQQSQLFSDPLTTIPIGTLSDFSTLHQPTSKDDLNTSLTLTKTESLSANPEIGGCTKRKRGRPKKEYKDKFIHGGLNEGFSLEEKPVVSSKNGKSGHFSQMHDDRLLMPPPNKVPMRPIIMKTIEEKDSPTKKIPSTELDTLNPKSNIVNYALPSRTPLTSTTSVTEQTAGLLISHAAEGSTQQ